MATSTSKGKQWGFDTSTIDASVRPQDDFFHYANGGWFKRTEIPADESRWGTFLILRKKTELELKGILEKLLRQKRAVKGSPLQQIRDFYRSGMDMKRRNALGARPLTPFLKKVEELQTTADLVGLIPELHRYGLGVFFNSGVAADEKNSDMNIFHLFQGGLGLPEREYYLSDSPEQMRVRTAYRAYVQKLFVLLGESARKAAQKADAVLQVETKLAKASMKKEDLRDPHKTYHKLPLGKVQKLSKRIIWRAYLTEIGARPPASINVGQPDFIRALDRLLDSEGLEAWKAYLTFHITTDAASYLSDEFIGAAFDFYGRVLSGTKEMRPLWRRVLGVVSGALGEALGKLYVAQYFPPEAKRKMDELISDLFAVYAERLKKLDWMSPATKTRALRKLKAMDRKIGYPKKWKSYKGLVIEPDDYFGNVLRSSLYEHVRNIKKLGKRVDRGEWYMTPQTVNAYYNPTTNEIAFPAAILQPPYFSKDQDDAINYGAIGGVIGHEMTHGFDDEGSKFDYKGNLHSWWSKEDRARFEKKAKVLKGHFDRYALHGVHVNGQLTLGENIADLGGYAIALDAYKRHLAKHRKEGEVIEGFTPIQRFFLGAAQDWRELSRPEMSKMLILTDPHAPPIFRINGPTSNLPEFYEAFGLQKGDKLYRDPKSRAKIW